MKFRTLKDLKGRGFMGFEGLETFVSFEDIKREAIKWVKGKEGDNQIFTRKEWMAFFNITESDLKDKPTKKEIMERENIMDKEIENEI